MTVVGLDDRPSSSPSSAIESAIGTMAHGLARELSQPRRRAFWAGWITSFIYLASRRRFSPILTVVGAELGGYAAMRAWQAAEDLSTLAAAAAPPERAHDDQLD